MKALAGCWMFALRCMISSVAFGAVTACAFFVHACPFCTQTSKTLSEEIEAADATIIAKIIEGPAEESDSPEGKLPQAKFEVVQVIKGEEHLAGAKQVEAYFFGEFTLGSRYLITGMVLPNLEWSTPIPLSDRGQKYVGQLHTLAESGPDRLAFFQEFLEDEESLMSRDAYDEFARAPYADVEALGDRMHHDRLLKWIRNQETSPSHRRLYLTMLGVCGSESDLAMLEEMLRSKDRKDKQALDALIACYLTLKGPSGMPLVENLFLRNLDAEYADTYAAIMAIRFHGEETETIPKPRLLAALHCMLDRPKLADLVISDLSRWEDWAVMDQLAQLFRDADAKNNWVRVPVITYLQVAREEEGDVGTKAEQLIEELAKIDPKAVQQAEAYGAFGLLAAGKNPPPGSSRPESSEKPAPDKKAKPAKEPAQPLAADSEEEEANDASADIPAPKLEATPEPRITEKPAVTPPPEPLTENDKPQAVREADVAVAQAEPATQEAVKEPETKAPVATSEPQPQDELVPQDKLVSADIADNEIVAEPDSDEPALERNPPDLESPQESTQVRRATFAPQATAQPSGATGLGTGVAVGIVIVFVTMIFSLGNGRP